MAIATQMIGFRPVRSDSGVAIAAAMTAVVTPRTLPAKAHGVRSSPA